MGTYGELVHEVVCLLCRRFIHRSLEGLVSVLVLFGSYSVIRRQVIHTYPKSRRVGMIRAEIRQYDKIQKSSR